MTSAENPSWCPGDVPLRATGALALPTRTLSVDEAGRRAVAVTLRGELLAIDLEAPAVLSRRRVEGLTTAALRPDGEALAVGRVELVELASGEVRLGFDALGPYEPAGAAFHPTRQLLAWIEGHARVHGHDLRHDRRRRFEFRPRTYLSSLAFHPEERLLAVGLSRAEVALVDLDDETSTGTQTCWEAGADPVLRFLPGGELLVLGNTPGLLLLEPRRGRSRGAHRDVRRELWSLPLGG